MNKVLVRIVGLVLVVAAVVILLLVAGRPSTGMRFALVPKSVGHPYLGGRPRGDGGRRGRGDC